MTATPPIPAATRGRVVHVDDHVPNAYYVGRVMPRHVGSLLANPYKIGRDGDRAEVIRKFETWLNGFLEDPDIVAQLIACRGRPLACWCRHDGEERTEKNACHADIILATLDRYTDAELRAMGARKP